MVLTMSSRTDTPYGVYKIHKPKWYDSERNKHIKEHNSIEDLKKRIHEKIDPNQEYNTNYIESDLNKDNEQQKDIFIGYDYKTDKKILLLEENIPQNILVLGNNGSGKTTEIFLEDYALFLKYNNHCLVHLDWKDEAKDSLSYDSDGTPTFLMNRITEITDYKKGDLNNLLGPDKIIIINLVSVKRDVLLLTQTLYNVLLDLNEKLKYFESIYLKRDLNDKLVLTRKLPYLILLSVEETYKIFPSKGSPVYKEIMIEANRLYNKRKSLDDQAKMLMKEEPEWAERLLKESNETPNLYLLFTKMMVLAQDNINTMRYLGLGYRLITQRPQNVDIDLVSGCNTWIVMKGQNAKADEEILKTSHLNKDHVKEFLKIPPSKRHDYKLVSAPNFKGIVRNLKPFLFHKAKDIISETRTDLNNVRQLE